jgi:hypothetical protein
MLVVWAVTPLQNAIFSNSAANISRSVPVYLSSGLVSLPEQTTKLDNGFLNNGFGILWLSQKAPPFTTPTFALSPFILAVEDSIEGVNQTLAAGTTLYGTDLDCHPPADVHIESDLTLTFDDGNGCIASHLLEYADGANISTFTAHYVGYLGDTGDEVSLATAGCPPNSSHTFLAIWKRTSLFAPDFSNSTNATALFCTPSYYTQLVNATVTLPDYAVNSTVPVGPKVSLPSSSFNMTRFENILALGVPPDSGAAAGPQQDPGFPQDVINSEILKQDSRLFNMSLTLPTDGIFGFAIGRTHREPDEYLNPDILKSSLTAAHQFLFGLAIHEVLIPPAQNAPMSATAKSSVQGTQIVPAFALISEIVLGIIFVSGARLFYNLSSRRPVLGSDPDSLASVIQLGRDKAFLEVFERQDLCTGEELAQNLVPYKFRLATASDHCLPSLYVHGRDLQAPSSVASFGSGKESRTSHQSRPSPVQPLLYSQLLGLSFVGAHLGLGIALIYLFWQAQKHNGMSSLLIRSFTDSAQA